MHYLHVASKLDFCINIVEPIEAIEVLIENLSCVLNRSR